MAFAAGHKGSGPRPRLRVDMTDLVGELQTVELAQLEQRGLTVIDQLLVQPVTESRGIIIGRAVSIELLLIEFVMKTDVIEQPAVQTVQ